MNKLFNRVAKDKEGFTLIELIVVVAILAVLAAVLVPTISGQIGKANTAAGNANAHTIYTAVQIANASTPITATFTNTAVPSSVALTLGTLPTGATFTVQVSNSPNYTYKVTYSDTTGASGSYPN